MSFKLEALHDRTWDAETLSLRFVNESDAREYAQRLSVQWGVASPIRVQPSDDPPNCKMDGGIGNRHLLELNPDKPDARLKDVGNLPSEIHTAPVDREKHWSILDQTKAEMKKAGRAGIVLLDKEDPAYKAKMATFLARFNHKWDAKKPYLVIQHDTEAKALFEAAQKAGLDAELI